MVTILSCNGTNTDSPPGRTDHSTSGGKKTPVTQDASGSPVPCSSSPGYWRVIRSFVRKHSLVKWINQQSNKTYKRKSTEGLEMSVISQIPSSSYLSSLRWWELLEVAVPFILNHTRSPIKNNLVEKKKEAKEKHTVRAGDICVSSPC